MCCEAQERYEEALKPCVRIAQPYSIGETHRRLARIAPDSEQRRLHVQAAREAWRSIDRPDLVKQLDEEFLKG